MIKAAYPEGANCAFRLIQEALTNVAKHAQATKADVEIWELQSDGIQIVVTDNGRGISDADRSKPTSLGLIGLEERLLTLGGSLRIATVPSGGTRLTAVISRPTKST